MSLSITSDWIESQGAQAVCAMLIDAGYQAHFVGGCVRNALLGVPVTDLDISTDARPDKVTELAKKAGFNPVPTGVDHGTVTVVVRGEPFEVTTWRRDVETDGRRAVVAFADSLEEDARRRDFTMNALYATPDGKVVDPLGGINDLRARRLRFIDNAADRIREDYLRILRFFRFHAWYGDDEAGFDPDALDAIAKLSAGIETLSRERVGAEIVKLLSAPDPAPSVAAMAQTGALAHVMPGLVTNSLPILIHIEGELGLSPDPMRRLAALGGEGHGGALRLSKSQDRALSRLLDHRGTSMSPAVLGYRFGIEDALSIVALNAALFEATPPETVATQIGRGAEAKFPVEAADLIDTFQGPALGSRLRDLEAAWIASDFQLTKEELLTHD